MDDSTKLLTLRNVPLELVRNARIITGKGTGSQAFIAGIQLLIQNQEQLAQQEVLIAKLRADVRRSRVLLRELAPLCIQVAEIAGQEDLFDEPFVGFR